MFPEGFSMIGADHLDLLAAIEHFIVDVLAVLAGLGLWAMFHKRGRR